MCGQSTILSTGDTEECSCGSNFSLNNDYFRTKENWEEYEYFQKWEDESCGNYVGFLLKTNGKNIIVSREYAGEAGLYNLTICNPGITSGSDPFGEHPELWKNRITVLNLNQVKQIVKILS